MNFILPSVREVLLLPGAIDDLTGLVGEIAAVIGVHRCWGTSKKAGERKLAPRKVAG
jgi:hypothetical protein